MKIHSRSYLHKLPVEVDRVVSEETGELIEENSIYRKYLVIKDRDYLILYTKVLTIYKNLSRNDLLVMAYLLDKWEYRMDSIYVGTEMREKGCEWVGCARGSFNNSISKLTTEGILIRDVMKSKRSQQYYFHPDFYYKGNQLDYKKKLRMILEIEMYNKKNK